MEWLLGIAAALTALGVIFRFLIRPAIKAAVTLERVAPVLIALAETFGNQEGVFQVLSEIAAEFRSDSGSTLKDSINRLEGATERLEAEAAVDRRLDEEARARTDRLMIVLGRIEAQAEAGGATGLRIEAEGEKVARDLKGSQERASEAEGPEGAAADAAAIPDKENP